MSPAAAQRRRRAFDKIGKLLGLHGAKTERQEQIVALTAMTGLTQQWLAKDTDPKDAPTGLLLEDILAEASRDLGQAPAGAVDAEPRAREVPAVRGSAGQRPARTSAT